MSKRDANKFKRRTRDCYDTPFAAFAPVERFVPRSGVIWEPCAGAYKLAGHIKSVSPKVRLLVTDIEPRHPWVQKQDALNVDPVNSTMVEEIWTNPPFDHKVLHPMLDLFLQIAPTWLLLPADRMHTQRFAPYMAHCRKIVSVGRVAWMENGTVGYDNFAWFQFMPDKQYRPPSFIGPRRVE